MPASVVLVMSCTATTSNSCNTFQADSLYRRSITQANMSAATGYIIYAYLKFLIMGQQLVRSGYVWLQWTGIS